MNWKYLFCALSVMPMAATAAIPYRVEQTSYVGDETIAPNRVFAAQYPFYIGGAYNFSIWDDYTDDNNVAIDGMDTSSFDVAVGYRIFDTFRIEANYIHTDAKWDAFSLDGDGAMINAIFDARIDSIYRVFQTRHIVPYVGFGAGATWLSSDDVKFERDTVATVAAIAGISFEFGGWWAFDLGYKYFYMFTPEFKTVGDMAPTSHVFRAGARLNF